MISNLDATLSAALKFDPFSDDFGDSSDVKLADKIVTARKSHTCDHCGSAITPGQRSRVRTEIINESLLSWRWCQPCTTLMAQMHSSNDEDQIERYEDAFNARHGMNGNLKLTGRPANP